MFALGSFTGKKESRSTGRFTMLLIPSIDIRHGKCVQLIGGKPETERVYGDPVEQAQRWVAEGAKYLHLVDLDAAMGEGDNFKKVAEVLAATNVPVQVGGGIRTLKRACELLGIGAERVIIGTAAVKNPDFAKELVTLAGGARVVVALDSKSGKVAVEGWKERTERTPLELARLFEGIGVGSLLFTNIDVEGSMRGVPLEDVQRLVGSVSIPIIVSGGTGSLEDVRRVSEAGATALVVGLALYEGRFSLPQAMKVAGE
jgi:phosphoribosylformimino-5-aminoimidazole carboxamide ribotide isomerase